MPVVSRERGFTLVELMIAMAMFSFMLLIVMAGFMNVMRLHNEALAANAAQDNARTGMDQLVSAVRNSSKVVRAVAAPNGSLCVQGPNGDQTYYYVVVDALSGSSILKSDTSCGAVRVNPQSVTASVVTVTNFGATSTTPVGGTVPNVALQLTVGTANGTLVTGTSTCGQTVQERSYCSVVAFKTGAEPR